LQGAGHNQTILLLGIITVLLFIIAAIIDLISQYSGVDYSFLILFTFNIVNCHHLKMNTLCPSYGKKRDSMNSTNWIRHKESCQKKKAVKRTASSFISNYFKCEGKFQKFEQSRK